MHGLVMLRLLPGEKEKQRERANTSLTATRIKLCNFAYLQYSTVCILYFPFQYISMYVHGYGLIDGVCDSKSCKSLFMLEVFFFPRSLEVLWQMVYEKIMYTDKSLQKPLSKEDGGKVQNSNNIIINVFGARSSKSCLVNYQQ